MLFQQLTPVRFPYATVRLPERFDLSYKGADGALHQPVMIHRAPFGSMERFVGVLIEHFGGAFPTWLAPTQVRIITVSDRFADYAEGLAAQMKAHLVRVEVDLSNETMGKKIRNGVTAKIPNLLIVGEREEEEGTVTLRRYGIRAQETMSYDAFEGRLLHAIAERTTDFPE